jgi:DNA-binding MarR family transcriptional regulator
MSRDEASRESDSGARDSIDALLASWAQRRPDLDFEPVGVISRLYRVRSHIDNELEPVFRRFGLSGPDFEALVTLARIEGDGGVSLRRLADELGLTSGTVSVRIDRLAAEGLVERRVDPDSKRSTLIALTSAGRDRFERVAPVHLANERRLLAALSDAQQSQLADLLRKLLVEFEGSRPTEPEGARIGLFVAPAHVTITMRAAVGLPGVAGLLVRSIQPDTPAARANLQPGDVLVRAGGRELRSSAELYAALREARGGALRLTVLRGNEHVRARLRLDPGIAVEGFAAASSEPGRHTEHVF